MILRRWIKLKVDTRWKIIILFLQIDWNSNETNNTINNDNNNKCNGMFGKRQKIEGIGIIMNEYFARIPFHYISID